jgi:prophage regulatory protein
MPTKLIKLPTVVELTTLSKSTIYKMVKDGKFPKPVQLSERATGWRVSDVDAWLNNLAPTVTAGGVQHG